MVYVVVCPRCGRARSSHGLDLVRCVYCGEFFEGRPVWSGPPEEAMKVVKRVNSMFERARMSSMGYFWYRIHKPVKEMPVLEAKILYLLEIEGPMTCREVSERLGVSREATRRALQSLRRKGYVECFRRSRESLTTFLTE